MAGVARLQAKLSIQLQGQLLTPEAPVDVALAIDEGSTGVKQVATGQTDQALTAPGIVTFSGVYLLADQDISIKLGATGSNVAFTLSAGYPLTLLGTSLTTISLSNASGSTANVTYALVGT